jgi:hypothetical protein
MEDYMVTIKQTDNKLILINEFQEELEKYLFNGKIGGIFIIIFIIFLVYKIPLGISATIIVLIFRIVSSYFISMHLFQKEYMEINDNEIKIIRTYRNKIKYSESFRIIRINRAYVSNFTNWSYFDTYAYKSSIPRKIKIEIIKYVKGPSLHEINISRNFLYTSGDVEELRREKENYNFKILSWGCRLNIEEASDLAELINEFVQRQKDKLEEEFIPQDENECLMNLSPEERYKLFIEMYRKERKIFYYNDCGMKRLWAYENMVKNLEFFKNFKLEEIYRSDFFSKSFRKKILECEEVSVMWNGINSKILTLDQIYKDLFKESSKH